MKPSVEDAADVSRSEFRYVPALRYDFLTPLFDGVMHWLLPEQQFRQRLLELGRGLLPRRVLDLGCGTGSLTLMAKQLHGDAEVIGLDCDTRALTLAEEKLLGADLDVPLVEGLAYDLPFPENHFDLVLSSLMFHHLVQADKLATVRDVLRVLRPGGELHVVDWGPARNPLLRAGFLCVQLLDGFSTTRDSLEGILPSLLRDAGFATVEELDRLGTPRGSLSFYRALKAS